MADPNLVAAIDQLLDVFSQEVDRRENAGAQRQGRKERVC